MKKLDTTINLESIGVLSTDRLSTNVSNVFNNGNLLVVRAFNGTGDYEETYCLLTLNCDDDDIINCLKNGFKFNNVKKSISNLTSYIGE